MSQTKKWILLATAVMALGIAVMVGLLLHWTLVPRLSPADEWQAVVVATAGAVVAAAATMWVILAIVGASFKGRVSPREAQTRGGSAAPATLSEFVGREQEIERLVERLRPGKMVAVTGITGMGGVGKTELARVAAARVADRFRDGVLWAECGKQELPAIAGLWAGVWGEQLAGDDEVAKAEAWRALVSGREALLVFDDVQPGQPVETLFPAWGRSAVLVTTRDVQHPGLREAECLALDQFTGREAMDLARAVLGESRAEDQAGEAGRFFRLVGYLPLGVSVGLHQARESGWDLATLNGRLEAAGALAVLDDEDRLRKSLNASFEAAWQSLGALQPTFAALALFGEGTSFDTSAAAAVLGVDEAAAGAQLERLVDLSLLSRAGGAGVPGEGRWTLHTLLRAFASGKGPLDEGTPARLAGHYAAVCGQADRLYKQGGEGVQRGLGLFDLEWPHIRAGQAWAAARWQENDEAARLCSVYPDAGVYCLSLRLGARERIGWLEPAAGAARRLRHRAAEGRHLGNLGRAYADLGEARRAIQYYEQALAISREICAASTEGSPQWTASRRGEGNSLGSLGNAHAALGEPQRAIEYYSQALAISREIGDRRGEGNRLGNLGNAYVALGEPQRAIECYEEALAIAREIGDRRGEGANVGNLGNAHRNLGEARQALSYYEEALAISREIGDRRNEGIHLGNLGNAYAALGETHRAVEYYEEALAISREIGDRRGEGNRLGNLGLAYLHLGEVGRAVEYHEEALAVTRQVGDRRAEGSHLANLGNAYADLGEARRAIDYYEQALAVAREICAASTEGSPEWTASLQGVENRLNTLASAYWALGEPQRAIECTEEALAIAREICAASTEGSPEWTASRQGEGNRLNTLGDAYRDLGEARRAIQYYEAALAVAREICAASTEGSPEWTASRRAEGSQLGNLGNAACVLGKARRAIEYFEQALAISRETGDRPAQGANLDSLGHAYADLGEAQRAIEYLEEALAIGRETGDRHAEAATLGGMGNAYVALGEARQATEYYEQALAIAREIGDRKGEASHLGSLGNAYVALGDSRRAIEHHQQALAIARETGDSSSEKMTLGSLGLACASLGEAGQAIEYFEEALAISRETGDRHNEEITLGNLGLAYAALGEVQRAIEYFEEAVVVSREVGDRQGEASHLGNLGLAYTDLGQAEQAIECYDKALAIARETGDRQSEGADLGSLGNAYRALGQAGRAIEHYQGALAISRETGDRRAEGAHLGSLGNAYSALRQVPLAIDHYERALAISREICAASTEGSPEWTASRRSEQVYLASLGLAYRHLGEPQRAIDYYAELLAIAREICAASTEGSPEWTASRRAEASQLANLGLAYSDLGKGRRAIECYEQALIIAREIGDRRAEGKHLGNLGLAHAALGEARRAIQYFEEALAIAREIGDRRAEGNHSWNLGLLFAEPDPLQAAELMGVLVAYEKEIGHPAAEADGQRVAEILARAGRRRRSPAVALDGE